MKVTELKNYGVPFLEIMYGLGPDILKRAENFMLKEVRRELGYLKLVKFGWRVKKEIDGFKQSLPGGRYIRAAIKAAAGMKVLAEMVGMEKASDIHRRLFDLIGSALIGAMFPSVADFQACGEVFPVLKEYCRGTAEANERAGTHRIEIVETGDRTFIFRVKYCVLHAVAAVLGDPYFCYPSNCYADEKFFPSVCDQAGIEFKREGTLATGAHSCDFTFTLK